MNNTPDLSLCMIVKDEEANLARCLRSVQGVVRQLVVVDTGSTDRTREIAASFGAELHEFAWINDFSAARNFSLRFATCPWVMYIDADEELAPDSAARLAETIRRAEAQKIESIAFDLQDKDAAGRVTATSCQPRLWRRADSVYFVNAIHNTPLIRQPVLRNGLIIYHYGYTDLSPETFARKRQRNFAIFEKEYEKNPDDTRLGWELARECCLVEQYDRALEVITRTIACHRHQCPGKPVEMVMYEYLSRSQHRLGLLDQALATIQEARAYYPDHFTFLLRAGRIHGQRQEWALAMADLTLYFEKIALYRAGKILTDEVLVEGLYAEPEAKRNMAIICSKLDRPAESCRWLLDVYQDGEEEPTMQVLAGLSGRLGKKYVLPLLDEMVRCRKSQPLKDFLIAVCKQLSMEDMEYLRRFMAELKAWPV
jgi:glycosyltransferase involved in cell wall biosynthesis